MDYVWKHTESLIAEINGYILLQKKTLDLLKKVGFSSLSSGTVWNRTFIPGSGSIGVGSIPGSGFEYRPKPTVRLYSAPGTILCCAQFNTI